MNHKILKIKVIPCSGGPTDEERPLQAEIDRLKGEVSFLKGCVCAVIRQIRSHLPDMSMDSFLEIASKNGGVDIVEFWKHHRDEDTIRMSDVLRKLSKHETEILKDLLKD